MVLLYFKECKLDASAEELFSIIKETQILGAPKLVQNLIGYVSDRGRNLKKLLNLIESYINRELWTIDCPNHGLSNIIKFALEAIPNQF